MQKITTLVLPVAGMGKRLLPLTKHTPKNLVLVNGKPILEYVLEEAVASGMKDIILIISPKHEEQFKEYIATSGKKKFPQFKFYIRKQETPGGNGHAIAQAADLIGNKPFAVRFCDDVIAEKPPVLGSLIEIFKKYKAPVMLLERVPKKAVSRYGVIGFKKTKEAGVYKITKIIEKPKAKDAPSNLIIVGGYILTPDIMRNLRLVADTLPVVADDALPLAVALQIKLVLKEKLYGWEFPGKRLDCGTLEKLQQAERYLQSHKS